VPDAGGLVWFQPLLWSASVILGRFTDFNTLAAIASWLKED